MGKPKLIWVDEEFANYLDHFGKDIEDKLGFKLSSAKTTKTLVKVLNAQDLKVENGKKKRNTKKTFELTFLL